MDEESVVKQLRCNMENSRFHLKTALVSKSESGGRKQSIAFVSGYP